MASDPTEIPDGVPGDRVDALYGLPIDDFTSSRDALAKELRQARRREQAAWVAGLRRPTAAAWVVNQLARTQARAAKRLLQAGEELREAHRRLMAGEAEADDLRAADEQVRKALRALLATAPGLLDRDGDPPSRSTLEKAGETLQAVALDEQTRAAFAPGRLTRERQASGLGLFAAATAPAPAAPKRAARNKSQGASEDTQERPERAAGARERKTVEQGKDQQRAQRRALDSAERERRQARDEAGRAQRRLEQAASELERARASQAQEQARVAEAQAAEEQARALVAEAEAAEEQAQAGVAEARAAETDAQARVEEARAAVEKYSH